MSVADFTGASNATFSLSLALVTSNTGGNTKKMIASAITFMGTAVGNIVGECAKLHPLRPAEKRHSTDQQAHTPSLNRKRPTTRPVSLSAWSPESPRSVSFTYNHTDTSIAHSCIHL